MSASPLVRPLENVPVAPVPTAPTTLISVIVPVYNGGVEFDRCLAALAAAQPPPYEILVVDDGSTDATAALAATHDAHIVTTPAPRSGPAVGRNLGAAEASGTVLFFVDADVAVAPDVCARLTDAFADPTLAALFGSYDDAPAARGFIAQYKNLIHYYTHQTSAPESSSFWAGCGAIRRDIFLAVGGFATSFTRPCIEDIELGYRLTRAGYRIRLEKSLQVKHLKQWTLRSMIASDIFDRAMPWTRLLKQADSVPSDLNLQTSNRVSALLCWLLLGLLCLALFLPWALLGALACAVALLWLNAPVYRFLYHARGFGFMLAAIPLHWLYYLYSSLTFAYVLFIEPYLPLPTDPSPH